MVSVRRRGGNLNQAILTCGRGIVLVWTLVRGSANPTHPLQRILSHMGSTAPTGSDPSAVDLPVRRRPPRIKKRRRMPASTMYAIVFAVLLAFVVLLQFAVHMARTDPRDSRAIAERELQ